MVRKLIVLPVVVVRWHAVILATSVLRDVRVVRKLIVLQVVHVLSVRCVAHVQRDRGCLY